MALISQRGDSPTPWYKHPWPLFLLSIPLATIIAGIITTWIAVQTRDPLVEDDYYKQGLAVNKKIASENEARARLIKGQLMLGADGAIRLQIEGQGEFPPEIQLRLIHPTQAEQDVMLPLQREATGWYEGKQPGLAATRWNLHLQSPDQSWRISGQWDTRKTPVFKLDGTSPGA